MLWLLIVYYFFLFSTPPKQAWSSLFGTLIVSTSPVAHVYITYLIFIFLQLRLLKHNWLIVAGSVLVQETLAFLEVCYPYEPCVASLLLGLFPVQGSAELS